jgi:VWFA-related protein
VLGVAALVAPAPCVEQDAPEPPSFPTIGELVVLDLVARDKNGRLVEDLRADDVKVFENGLPCLVRSFRLVRAGPGGADAGVPSAVAPPDPAGATSPTSAGPTAGAPTTPTAPAAAGTRANVVLLVFDRLSPENADAARVAATELVKRPFPPGTWMAVVSATSDIRLVLGLTDDLGRLPNAVATATAGSVARVTETPSDPDERNLTDVATSASLLATGDVTGVAGVDPEVQQLLRNPDPDRAELKKREIEARVATAVDTLNRERLGRSTLSALLRLTQALAPVEGRKTLLFFSEGLHVPESVGGALDTTVSEANRANVAVYAFDPRGLRTESDSQSTTGALLAARNLSEKAMRSTGDEDGPNRGASPLEVKAHDLALDALRLDTQANLRDLAESTGGFLVANRNDLSSAIERVGADLRSYYEIGYEPANPIADGAFRRVEVKLARRGLSVRTRRGYLALPVGTASTLPYELPLSEILAQADPPHELAFELRAAPGSVADNRAAVELSVSVPLRAVELEADAAGANHTARFAVLVLVRDSAGQIAARLSHDWPLSVPAAQVASARERAATIRRSVELPPGRYTVEAALQDRLSGAAGVSRTAFQVGP